MTRIAVRAPLTGWALPLAEVCDEVFAQGLVGDGLAIDPLLGELRAPFDGVVVLPGAAKHALSVRHASGVEVMMHVGIDTVALHGEGFDVAVRDGQSVGTGDVLLRFDLDRVARGAKSVVTPVLVVGGGVVVSRVVGRLVRAGDEIASVETETSDSTGLPRTVVADRNAAATHGEPVESAANRSAAPARGEPVESAAARSAHFRIPFDHGLHARPAAQLIAALRGLDSQVTLVAADGRSADARSATALMRLGVQLNDRVEVRATGPQAHDAIAALSRVLSVDGSSDSSAPSLPAEGANADLRERRSPPTRITGLPAAPGLAIGTAFVLADTDPTFTEHGEGEPHERQRLANARAHLARHLQQHDSDIAIAHLALLEDPELTRAAEASLHAGKSAAHAWRQATRALAAQLATLADERMRERAADLRDLERQGLRVLAGESPDAAPALPPNAIVFTDELLPSQLAALDATRLAGIVMARGGATSHVALLAAARGIPTLVGAGGAVFDVPGGVDAILDIANREALIAPKREVLDAIHARLAQRLAREAQERAACGEPALTRDGTRIAVHANIGAIDEIAPARALGAEGCGLLRTEFLFLERHAAPSEDEQFEHYAAAARAFDGHALTIRTLDVGGDKPLAYVPMPREENPALGVRGLRVGLRQPALLRTQLRALLRAAAHGEVRVMLPMVNDGDDLRAARALWDEEARSLGIATPLPLGAMIETPAAALLAPALARHADFFSIGSNDLSQYVLAMDRGNADLAGALDALHPAVLRAIAAVLASGASVSLCGGLASDVEALPVLVGLGLREFSAVPARIPAVKRALRELDVGECVALARRALDCDSAMQVRALIAKGERA